MPLRWTISPLEHTVVCVADDIVTFADIAAYFDALEKARAVTYQKIFVAAGGKSGLSKVELAAIAVRLSSMHKSGPMGAMAIVTGSPRNDGLADVLRLLVRVDRPLRPFASIHQARRWLAAQKAMRRAPGTRTR